VILRTSRRLAAILAAVVLALAVAGCHSSTHHDVSASASAAAKADAAKGEQIVAACMKSNTTAHAIYRCVVPAGSGPRLKGCVLKAIAAHDPLQAGQRKMLESSALPQCVEKYR